MNKHYIIIWLFGSMLLLSCVEEIPLGNPSEFPPELVVEGSINDFDDTFRVRLQTTSSLRGLGVNLLGTGAWVRIISDTDTTQLNEVQPGIYDTEPDALSIATGRPYYLDIVLGNDEHYQSTPVTLPEPMPVTAAFATPVNTSRIDELGVFRRSWAHAITIEFENSPNPQYFKTDMTGWREKYVSYTSETILYPTRCWALENPATRGVTIGTNLEVESGNYLALTGAIRADGKERYIAEIKTSSLSEEAYLFWLAARTQLDRDKGVFVEPFAAVIGNIRNVNGDNEVVHGYFHAYSQQLIRTCFESFDLPLGNPVSVIGEPCADFFAPAEYQLPFQAELCGE
ncbi:MAG: DUF4249 family protein [Cytophagales bacterium]|nr:DUF4249 family protein [Cytophagales bacterium]